MNEDNTALLLIGYQNDYFAEDGILRHVIENSADTHNVLNNTISLLEQIESSRTLIVSTPIVFTRNYEELSEATGVLKAIKEAGAFKDGTQGAETVPQFHRFKDRILNLPGKRGLNAFSNTNLSQILAQRRIRHIVIAGVVTSICIDSTGRAAHDQGLQVSILSDCSCGRTAFEQEFYCQQVFPLYASVLGHQQFSAKLGVTCQ